MARNKLYAQFHILLSESGGEAYKQELLSSYGVTSTRDLTDGELAQLIATLRGEQQREVKSKRAVVLTLLTELGVYYIAPGEPSSARWKRVNSFLRQDRIAGKLLYEMSISELDALIRKLRAMKSKGYYRERKSRASESDSGGLPRYLVHPLGSA